jgi:hypothetical protein
MKKHLIKIAIVAVAFASTNAVDEMESAKMNRKLYEEINKRPDWIDKDIKWGNQPVVEAKKAPQKIKKPTKTKQQIKQEIYKHNAQRLTTSRQKDGIVPTDAKINNGGQV